MSNENTRLTDLAFLQNFTAGNKEKIAKYINMFLQYAPQQMNNLENALANADWDSLRTAAHSMKPQIAYMGIKSQENVIRSIEEHAGNRTNLEHLPEIISGFKSALEEALNELKAELGNL